MDLYPEELMDHYHYPRNRGHLDSPDFSSGEYNPACGDSISFEGRIKNGLLEEVMFNGKGCVISQVAASMLTELCKGKSLDEILKIDKDFIVSMLRVKLGPNRLKCALLPLQALQGGIMKYCESYKKKADA